jgi:hypothetical protein
LPDTSAYRDIYCRKSLLLYCILNRHGRWHVLIVVYMALISTPQGEPGHRPDLLATTHSRTLPVRAGVMTEQSVAVQAAGAQRLDATRTWLRRTSGQLAAETAASCFGCICMLSSSSVLFLPYPKRRSFVGTSPGPSINWRRS